MRKDSRHLSIPFRGSIDRNLPVINLPGVQNRFEGFIDRDCRWPAVNLRWQEGTKKERKKKEDCERFFFKVRKGRNKKSLDVAGKDEPTQ